MDRTELEQLLIPFQLKCAENDKPLENIYLKEAFPGDVSTSYIVQVKASWIEGMSAYDAIDVLFDILWETTDEEIRKKVFSIQVLGSSDQLHSKQEAVVTRS